MIPYERVAELLWNTPLLLTPEKANTIAAFILTRIHDRASSDRSSRFAADVTEKDASGKQKPYMMTKDGTAIIPIIGELVNRGAWVGSSSGLVSYEGLQHQISQAISDPKVKEIVLDINSPGGEAAGAFETASFIRSAAMVKPIIGFVNAMAASGGYALASAASKIVTVPSATVGSIGVYYMHMDVSQAMQKDGIRPTLVYAGAHKIDGNPFEPLPNAVKNDIQARVEKTYEMFVDAVAQGRRNLTIDQIRGTEARVYNGNEAAAMGLVDAVGTIDDVLAAITDARRATTSAYSKVITKTRASTDAEASQEETDCMTLKEHITAAMTSLKAAITGEEPKAETSTPNANTDTEESMELTAEQKSALDQAQTVAKENETLRAEIAKRDAEAQAKADADAKTLENERKARIASEADVFTAKCANAGKEATESLRGMFIAAKESGDHAQVSRLETIAASFAVAPVARLPKEGPSAEEIADEGVKGEADIVPRAVKNLKARGVNEKSKNWSGELAAEMAKMRKGSSHAAV